MPTVSPALVPTFISFDEDDFFGEFEFATSVSASSSPSLPPPPPPHGSDSNHKQRQPAVGEDDDDWGDFVEGSLQPQLFGFSDPPTRPPPPTSSASSSAHFPSFFDPPFPATEANPPDLALIRPPPPVALNNGWQKPSGALPLSLFGGEDDEEDGGGVEASNSIDSLMPDLKAGLSPSPKSPGSKGLVSANGGGIKDLIASLYGQADKVGTVTPGNTVENGDNSMINGDNGAKSVYADGGDNDEDELDDWEFKDALSSASVGDSGDSGDSVLVEIVKKDGELAGIPIFESKAENNGSGLQVSSNYIFEFNGQERENTLGTSLPSRAFAIEQEWGSAFVSHGTAVNGFADNGCNSFTSNALHDFEHINIENGLYSNVANGDLSLDDSSWEFKDASSDIEIVKHFTEPESINQMAPNELGEPAGRNKNQDFGDAFLITEGSPYVLNSIDNGTENNKAGSVVDLNDLMPSMFSDTCHVSAVTPKQIAHGEQISAVSSESLKGADSTDLRWSGLESDKIRDNDFVSKTMDTEITTVVNFYSRLKQKSCTLARHHIYYNELRKAAEQDMTNEELEAVNFDDEIKAAISKLGTTTPKSDYIEKCPPNEFSISELLEVVQEPCFQAFDMEYHLSEKIPLAEKDLGSAMWLFEHASAVHYILMLASCEEQRSFINSWSKMVSACELELQHGAIIWSQALHANGQTQLLSESRGERHFFALGEIYRVVEILSAAIRLYKPWILLNPADSRDMLIYMEKSIETWTNAGLKHALEIISESSGELNVATEKLLKSTKFICELSTSTLQNLLSNHEAHFCRLSLLPLEMLSDIKPVVWNGDHYFSRLANLWANRVSFSAPQLPNIKVAQ